MIKKSDDIPWHRVMGQDGPGHARVKIRDPLGANVQRKMCTNEGIRFDDIGRVDLTRFGWSPNAVRAGRKR